MSMANQDYREVLVIGGGVIGLSVARELHKAGARRITLVEKGVCGGEASWAAAGMLGPQAEADEGGAFFDLCSASRDLYPDLAAELFEETGIDIELDRSGTLYLAFTDDDVSEVHKRFKWQRKAGLAVEHLSAEAVRQAEPFISPDVRGALYFPNDWQVENRKLVAALKGYAEINGIDIRENTAVEKLTVENGRVIGAETKTERLTADNTVLATGAWTSLIKLANDDMPVKVTPIRGQMICLRPDSRLFEHVIYTRRGYVVPRSDWRVLAGSTTEDVGFDKSVTETAALSLKTMACQIAPGICNLEVAMQWSGLRPYAADGLPIVGPISGLDGVLIATGHYRNGILLAPATGRMVADNLIDGKVPKFFRTL